MNTKQVKTTVAGILLSAALILPVTMITSPIPAQAAASSAGTSQQESPSLSNAQKADAIVAFAESLLGKVQYKWGVNDPKDLILDCSSFTKYVYSKQGINLKWGAAKQATQGVHVDKAELQKGDLVHFSLGTPGIIEHVGIYIGDGKFIHNLKPGVNVEISDLDSKYWKKHYVTATRILNDGSTAQAPAKPAAATSTDTKASPISADPTSPTPRISNDNSMIGEKVPEAVSTDTGKNVSSRSATVSSTHADSNNEYLAKPVNKINPIVKRVMAFLLPLLVFPFIWKYR